MTKYFMFSLITASLISSAAMADREDDLREELDLKGARVAIRAIANEYNVNWREFDFKNSEDDQRATKVQNYLDAVLASKKNPWYGVNPQKYEKYSTRQDILMNSWSDAIGSAFGGHSGPEFELTPEEAILKETSSSLASISGSSHEGMTPSSSSMSTNPEALLEQLDERETKAVLRAITHKFQVEWEKFDFTNPEDDQRATKVHNYLDADLRNKYVEWSEKSADIRRTNTDYLQDPNYLRSDARYKKYYSMQNALNDSWSNALMPL